MKKALIISTAWALPLVSSAQDLSNLQTLAEAIGRIINTLIPVVFALAILYFFWGLAQYILASGDSAAQESGRNKMIWGIVALFVMSAIWGLIQFLGTAVGIDTGSEPGFNVGDLVPDDVPGNN